MNHPRSMAEICRDLAEAAGHQHLDILAQLLRMAAAQAAESKARYLDPETDIRNRLVGTWDWDIVNDLVYADGRFAHLFGITDQQAANGLPLHQWLAAVHPDDIAALSNEIQDVIATGRVFAMEYRVVANDQVYWVYARGRCTFDQTGQAVRFPGAIVDITYEKLDDVQHYTIAPL